MEYRRVADAYELDLVELCKIATRGIESTWLDAVDRASLAREFEATLGELLPEARA